MEINKITPLCGVGCPAEDCDLQQLYLNLFRKTMGPYLDQYVELLKELGVWSDCDYKSNLRHAVQYVVHSEEDYGYNDAVQMIEWARQQNKDAITIDDIMLRNLPSSLSILKNVKTLYLSELDIQNLNSSIRELKNLQNVQITKCALKEIPDWISDLPNIETLQVTRCCITTVPVSLERCTKLKTLLLEYNRYGISSLPRGVWTLPNLERLNLDGNPLKVEWEEDYLPTCRHLSISQTKITNLPSFITSKIEYLSWWGCELTNIECTFGESLIYLNLSKNRLSDLPSLSNSSKLDLNTMDTTQEDFAAKIKIILKAQKKAERMLKGSLPKVDTTQEQMNKENNRKLLKSKMDAFKHNRQPLNRNI